MTEQNIEKSDETKVPTLRGSKLDLKCTGYLLITRLEVLKLRYAGRRREVELLSIVEREVVETFKTFLEE